MQVEQLHLILHAAGAPRWIRRWQDWRHQRPFTAIMFHAIGEAQSEYVTSAARLRDQIGFLKDHYPTVRLSEAPRILADPHSLPCVALTFDDAYTSFIEQAVPVLDSLGVPSTLFVPTGYLGKTNLWDWPSGQMPKLSIMTEAQLRELGSAAQIDIGSHSVNHRSMRGLSLAEMKREAVESRTVLDSLLGRRTTLFAYPYGQLDDFSDETEQALANAGYEVAVTTHWGSRNSPYRPLALHRIWFAPDDGPAEMRAKVEGEYDWFAAKERIGFALRKLSGRVRRNG